MLCMALPYERITCERKSWLIMGSPACSCSEITCNRMEDAEEALERHRFNLVIADIRLSGIEGIEGLELLTYIKRLHPETPVIIMTAYGTAEIKKDAYSRGAFYYFEKPIDIRILTDKTSELGIDLNINP